MLVTGSLGTHTISWLSGFNQISLEHCDARAGGQAIYDEITSIEPTTRAHTLENMAGRR